MLIMVKGHAAGCQQKIRGVFIRGLNVDKIKKRLSGTKKVLIIWVVTNVIITDSGLHVRPLTANY